MNGTAILYTAVAASANVLGAAAVVSHSRWSVRALENMVALSAGFMISVALLDLTPEAIVTHGPSAAIVILIGYLLVHLTQHTLAPHFHFGEETHEEAMLRHHAAMAGLGALLVHTFFDGVSIAVASLVNAQLGVLVFVAILLHKLPEGFTVASMMLAAGRSRRAARLAALAVGLATFVGVALVLLFRNAAIASLPLSAHILPLSAGVTLYVAASDLIPEVNTRAGGVRTSLLVFAGVALLYVIELMLEALHLGH